MDHDLADKIAKLDTEIEILEKVIATSTPQHLLATRKWNLDKIKRKRELLLSSQDSPRADRGAGKSHP